MTVKQSSFVWYELLSTDVAAAKAFYGKVVGWGVPGGNWIVQAADPQGALFALSSERK
jgi:uncharacterized protein